MGTRLRWLLMLAGALLVLATFTYPVWRPVPQTTQQEQSAFPELNAEQQQAFNALPPNLQNSYIALRQSNPQMALALVQARLAELPPNDEQVSPPEGATVVAQGDFAPVTLAEDDERDLPPFRELFSATGSATVYQFPDSSKILQFEDFRVTNGPNLRVVLSTLPTPLTGEELLGDRNRIDIGPLLTPIGSQQYESIPDEINIDEYSSVVIYDATYNLIFGVARLL